MEEVENFYLKVQANLRNLQATRLTREKTLPLKVEVYKNKKETKKSKRLHNKQEKLRNKINKGYHKGVADSIRIINKIFEGYLKECSND